MEYKNLAPVAFPRVEIAEGFWKKRIDTTRAVTVRACLAECERSGHIDNFRRAAGLQAGGHVGIFFDDCDVYKVLEGVAYVLMGGADAELEQTADDIIDIICAAQQPDGYLYTYYTLNTPEKRWTDMNYHEAFCLGMLIEAGIAYAQATGKDKLLNAAKRSLAQMMSVNGPEGQHWVTGHEGLEMALVRLYRHTGEKRYLDYANWLVEERGHGHLRAALLDEGGFYTTAYCQDDKPARELTRVTGHAVRATYYYSALADLVSLQSDDALYETLLRLHDDTTQGNLYLTGGIGQSAHNEGFTRAWSLPNLTAYCETCAAIGMAFWNARMNLIRGEAKYADLVELEMYNGILAGISLSGDKFFYENPLASVGRHHRRKWYGCSCCPTNIVRFLPSVGGYAYATAPGALYVNQFIASRARIALDGGEIALRVETNYPWEGQIKLTVDECPPATKLMLRLPGWCAAYTLTVNGASARSAAADGYLPVAVKSGDVLVYALDMPVRRAYPDPRVAEDEGRVAVARGPIVYCAEEVDNPGIPCEYFHAFKALAPGAALTCQWENDLLDGVVTLTGGGVKFVPYYAWDNRESGAMAVWLLDK